MPVRGVGGIAATSSGETEATNNVIETDCISVPYDSQSPDPCWVGLGWLLACPLYRAGGGTVTHRIPAVTLSLEDQAQRKPGSHQHPMLCTVVALRLSDH